jgi:TolA-binding protein
MTRLRSLTRPIALGLVLALSLPAAPVWAQNNTQAAEARIKKLESEVQALQRKVFPGGDGKYFPPQVSPADAPANTVGTPASTPVTDLLARMQSVESQLQRLTAQSEENANKLAQLQAKVDAMSAVPAPTVASAVQASTTAENLAAMTGTKPAAAVASPAAAPASRVAAVAAIEKPKTSDAGDDEYTYGFRLYDAKFYPEAQQQLKLYLQKFPKHARASFARNLLGRAYLDAGNPREAASWFLQNYQADKAGARAPDSLLSLAGAMRTLKDNSRACIALGQFADDYPGEATGRLKSQYDATRNGLTCK